MESALAFSAWETFYVIVGSSAAALTGLQFVVIALGAESRAMRAPEILAFASPTIVHFCAVLLISATLSAPWHQVLGAGLVLGVLGLAGIVYMVIVIRRTRRQTRYKPVMEDVVWYNVLPLGSYVALTVAAYELGTHGTGSLFTTAAITLILLFVGIHNAWDSVTYVATEQPQDSA